MGNKEIDTETIEKKAIDLLANAGFSNSEEPIDVVSIAKNQGFIVGNAVLDDDMDGFIIVNENEDSILGMPTSKLIGVNSDRELKWKRFIVAHELAHYMLHYSQNNQNGLYAHRDHHKGKDKNENEADYFAAALLMPTELFKKRFNEFKEKGLQLDEIILLLEDKFVVTHRMTERRVEELGLDVEQ